METGNCKVGQVTVVFMVIMAPDKNHTATPG